MNGHCVSRGIWTPLLVDGLHLLSRLTVLVARFSMPHQCSGGMFLSPERGKRMIVYSAAYVVAVFECDCCCLSMRRWNFIMGLVV